MRRRDLLAGALALAAGSAAASPVMTLHASPRALRAPSFVDGDGRALALADFSGRVVLLNVWATWCAPCREEMPTLDALQARLGGADFHVLALSIDRAGLDPVRRFYAEIGIARLGLYLARDIRAMLAFSVIGLPTTLLIDRQGRELGRLVGPAEWDSAAHVALFRSVIANERT